MDESFAGESICDAVAIAGDSFYHTSSAQLDAKGFAAPLLEGRNP